MLDLSTDAPRSPLLLEQYPSDNNGATIATPEQIKELERIAIDRYEQDGGIMAECYGHAELAEMIDAEGGIDAAWAMHMRITEARREAGGYYERF